MVERRLLVATSVLLGTHWSVGGSAAPSPGRLEGSLCLCVWFGSVVAILSRRGLGRLGLLKRAMRRGGGLWCRGQGGHDLTVRRGDLQKTFTVTSLHRQHGPRAGGCRGVGNAGVERYGWRGTGRVSRELQWWEGLAVVVRPGQLETPLVVRLGHARREVHLNAVVDVLLFDQSAMGSCILQTETNYAW